MRNHESIAGYGRRAYTVPMTTPDYTPYVEHARRQAARRREQAAARYDEAWIVARQIANFLRREYRPVRIIAFGSLVHREIFGLHSDIDIAVEGIPWPEYLRAWNAVEELFPAFKVDLIDLAIVSDLMRRRIEEEGQEL
ncbi:MAG TPA: nucleotidyltransferase domain-containing protein [Anaerolineae bacterium]